MRDDPAERSAMQELRANRRDVARTSGSPSRAARLASLDHADPGCVRRDLDEETIGRYGAWRKPISTRPNRAAARPADVNNHASENPAAFAKEDLD